LSTTGGSRSGSTPAVRTTSARVEPRGVKRRGDDAAGEQLPRADEARAHPTRRLAHERHASREVGELGQRRVERTRVHPEVTGERVVTGGDRRDQALGLREVAARRRVRGGDQRVGDPGERRHDDEDALAATGRHDRGEPLDRLAVGDRGPSEFRNDHPGILSRRGVHVPWPDRHAEAPGARASPWFFAGTPRANLPRAMSRTKKRTLVLGALLLPAVIGGAGLGYGLKLDLPDVEALDRYTPALNTRVVARDGSSIGSFGDQRRTLLAQKDIPKNFEQALVAVEDSHFYEHGGVDVKGIARAAWHDLTTMSFAQGASTITQQLSRNLFLTQAKTAKRKLQEMMLALEIERRYSKEEILRMYCNQVYMGHGRYGLEAAAQLYFSKHAPELNLPEAALLAGLVQRPETLSPLKNPELAVKRRNHVLDRMAEEKMLTREEANAAKGAPLQLLPHRDAIDLAPYFVEEVRRAIQAKYGEEGIYRSGLEIKTGLDPAMQRAANARDRLGPPQARQAPGWRGRIDRVPAGWTLPPGRSASWRDGRHRGVDRGRASFFPRAAARRASRRARSRGASTPRGSPGPGSATPRRS
jgi:hypothetical protein